MFKTIKGYIRRLTTMKKDKTIQIDMPEYGEFEAQLIDACIVNDEKRFTNIIVVLSYDNTKEEMKNMSNQLKLLLSISKISCIGLVDNNTTNLYISSEYYRYKQLIELYYFDPKYRYNKLFCILKNLLCKIDICSDICPNIDNPPSYYADRKYIRPGDIYIENISTILSPELIDKLYPLLITCICYDREDCIEVDKFDINSFLYRYYNDNMNYEGSTTIYNNRHKFIIDGKKYKSIFDITFKVNNQDSSDDNDEESFDEEIDEVLD